MLLFCICFFKASDLLFLRCFFFSRTRKADLQIRSLVKCKDFDRMLLYWHLYQPWWNLLNTSIFNMLCVVLSTVVFCSIVIWCFGTISFSLKIHLICSCAYSRESYSHANASVWLSFASIFVSFKSVKFAIENRNKQKAHQIHTLHVWWEKKKAYTKHWVSLVHCTQHPTRSNNKHCRPYSAFLFASSIHTYFGFLV